MGNRVTLQEIADTLGLSRNTVSRALNNTGNVSPETRNKICQAALSMGYKQFNMAGYVFHCQILSHRQTYFQFQPNQGRGLDYRHVGLFHQ